MSSLRKHGIFMFMTAVLHKPLSIMLCCDSCRKDYVHANIDFEKPNDFITCPSCKATSFLHKSMGSNSEKYFEILGSDFAFKHDQENMAEAQVNLDEGGAISEENMRLWINDSLSDVPEEENEKKEPFIESPSENNDLSEMLDDALGSIPVMQKNGTALHFKSLAHIKTAIEENQLQGSDIVDYENQKAPLDKHSKTKFFFGKHQQQAFMDSLQQGKTEVHTSKTSPEEKAARKEPPSKEDPIFVKVLTAIFIFAISLIISFLAYKQFG